MRSLCFALSFPSCHGPTMDVSHFGSLGVRRHELMHRNQMLSQRHLLQRHFARVVCLVDCCCACVYLNCWRGKFANVCSCWFQTGSRTIPRCNARGIHVWFARVAPPLGFAMQTVQGLGSSKQPLVVKAHVLRWRLQRTPAIVLTVAPTIVRTIVLILLPALAVTMLSAK